jgi:hypothetical protein
MTEEELNLIKYKLESLVEEVKKITDKLSTRSEINTEIEVTRRASILAEELVGKLLVKPEIKAKIDFMNIIKFISIIVISVLFLILMYDGFKKINHKIDDFGVPVGTFRGVITPLPPGYDIKVFPKDFDGKDTIK